MDIRRVTVDDEVEFRDHFEYWNRCTRLLCGPDANRIDPAVTGAHTRQIPEERRPVLLNAYEDGELVGIALSRARIRDAPIVAYVDVYVLPEHGGRGTGTALADRAEAEAITRGATRLDGGACLIEGDDAYHEAGVRFARHRGYRITQKGIIRELDLPARFDVDTDPGYQIETWEGAPPKAWLAGLGTMLERMASDAPTGDKEAVEEHWDVNRVREEYRPIPDVSLWFACAFASDGTMAGFRQLESHETEDPRMRTILHQGDTLVLREHRGHGLGAALKAAAISRAQQERPWLTRSRTTNAESNRPMVAINQRLGFHVTGFCLELSKEVGRAQQPPTG